MKTLIPPPSHQTRQSARGQVTAAGKTALLGAVILLNNHVIISPK